MTGAGVRAGHPAYRARIGQMRKRLSSQYEPRHSRRDGRETVRKPQRRRLFGDPLRPTAARTTISFREGVSQCHALERNVVAIAPLTSDACDERRLAGRQIAMLERIGDVAVCPVIPFFGATFSHRSASVSRDSCARTVRAAAARRGSSELKSGMARPALPRPLAQCCLPVKQ